MFDDLKAIFNENENQNQSVNENENEDESENENESESESDDESEKEKKHCYEIRQLHNWFETIDQTKSLEEQIEKDIIMVIKN